MKSGTKLILIKIVHTLIWSFFSLVVFYLLYAAVINQLDKWVWTGYAFIVFECIVLLIFRLSCPLTLIARRYSNSSSDNFDIYLPTWLAGHNKLICTIILTITLFITIFQLLKKLSVSAASFAG